MVFQNRKRFAFFLLISFSMLAFCKREPSASLLQSARIAPSRESVQDSCRPVKPSRASHRLENGVAIFADSEQRSRPLPFLSIKELRFAIFPYLSFAFLIFTRKYSASLLQSARIAPTRESNMDSC